MKPCEVEGCNCAGQKHHIVFRSQRGLDIELNYKYLCIIHHSCGKAAVHNNREFDLAIKRELQDWYYFLFQAEYYTIEEIANIIEYKKNRLEKRMKAVSHRAGQYQKEDIIRFLMGGRLY